jgi:hypothetical protein
MTDPLDVKPRARWPLDINAPARNGFGFAPEPQAGSGT